MSRRVYIWDEELKELVEVSPDYTPTPRVELMPGTCYDGVRATDGADIGSRRKHKDYMRRHGLTTADDYTETWAKAAERRAAFHTQGGDQAEKKRRREAVERAIYQRYKP